MKPPGLTWETLDWAALDRLRDTFLSGGASAESYWTSWSDLENYDFTFAQRIAWKWDAVLRELRLLGWTPPSDILVDWGCGSGIAGRRVVEFYSAPRFKELRVLDRSPLAMDFAAKTAREGFPELRVERADIRSPGGAEPGSLVVLSHVLSELSAGDRDRLAGWVERADAVLWVEPGTHADSRQLIAMREELREKFVAIAPCTHQAACGLLTHGNERHWCHHFAAPPTNIMADSNWVRFAQRAGIDLRSLPYSYLVLERKGLREPVPGLVSDGYSRVIGVPRFYKGFAKIFSCQADGVRDLNLQKRAAPQLFKAFKDGHTKSVHRWKLAGNRITGDSLPAPDSGSA